VHEVRNLGRELEGREDSIFMLVLEAGIGSKKKKKREESTQLKECFGGGTKMMPRTRCKGGVFLVTSKEGES